MKKNYPIIIAALAAAIGILCIALTGCATRPPSATEGRFFNIQTNYAPIVEVRTNIFTVTQVQTNVLLLTNVTGVTEFKTNLVPIFVYQTNVVVSTNIAESYVFKPGAGAAEVQQVATAVGNIFGVGGIVGTGVGMLFSLWGYFRSRKSNAVAVNLGQSIETMREFIKSLPNGAQYDNEIVNWLTTNQSNAGVLQQVIGLISSQISNPSAKIAAQQVMATIEALRNLPKS